MRAFKFDLLLQSDGWKSEQFIGVDEDGCIVTISSHKPAGVTIEEVNGFCIPGFQNAHSHAFQYAMAGLAEIHPTWSKADDFWSWRDTMYKIALSIVPEQLESIATVLYSEMLRHGYTSVAEFHYLHHNSSGNHYDNKSEMGERLLSAAKRAGINITLIPIYYQKGGFGKNPETQQRRFISKNIDEYLELLEASKRSVDKYRNAKLGQGFHSLRAVNEESSNSYFDQYESDLPYHIHVSEQLKEVDECLAHYGLRPVEWLLENAPVNEQFHLVHATHLTGQEIVGITKSKAQVVLCPSTEGNLGDGIFPLKQFQDAGGNWSIGTDSHIGLNPLEELRMLDYSQRLISHRRDQFVSKTNRNSGQFGYQMTLMAGRAAMGNHENDYFKVGEPFDAVIIDASNPLMSVSKPDNLLPTFVYAGDPTFLLGTISSGEWKVRNGKHIIQNEINADFHKTISTLGIR